MEAIGGHSLPEEWPLFAVGFSFSVRPLAAVHLCRRSRQANPNSRDIWMNCGGSTR